MSKFEHILPNWLYKPISSAYKHVMFNAEKSVPNQNFRLKCDFLKSDF